MSSVLSKPSIPYAEQARACWICSSFQESPTNADALESAGNTCHLAARAADALALATEILRRIAEAGIPSAGAATSISFDAATWLSIYCPESKESN